MNPASRLTSLCLLFLVLSACPPEAPRSEAIPNPRSRLDVDNTTENVDKIVTLPIDCQAGKKVEVWAEITGGSEADSVTVEAYCGLTQVANTVAIVPRNRPTASDSDLSQQTGDGVAGCRVTPIFGNPANPSTFRAYCTFE